MKAVPIIAALAGLAVVAGLVAGFGADAVIPFLLSAGKDLVQYAYSIYPCSA
jgi:hypothetical protein